MRLKYTFLPLVFLGLCCSCAMMLQPTTSFDRRLVARSYGKIISQSSPDCENCTDRFVVQKSNGKVIVLTIRFDGKIKVIE